MNAELEMLEKIEQQFTKNAESQAKKIKDLETQLEELGENVASGRNSGGYSRGKSLGSMFVDEVRNKAIDFTTLSKNEFKGIVIKLAGTMGTGNVDAVGTNSIPFGLSDFESGLTRVQRRQPYLLQIGNVSPISSMYAQWAEQENPDGAVTSVTQGSSKPQIDFDWVEKSQKVEKIAGLIKVTKEMLSDLAGIRNAIDSELREQVLLKADDLLWDGTGATPDIKGVSQFATAYSEPVALSGLVDNNLDKLRAGIAQVVENKFSPNWILMNPSDVAALDLLKSGDDGHYLVPAFRNGMNISQVPIVENLGVDQGSFLVGDFTKFNIRIREDFNISVGFDGNDFSKNLVSILGEMRLAAYVKALHVGAFVLGEFDAS